MSNIESDLEFKEVFLEKFQKLSLKVEQLTDLKPFEILNP